MKERSTKWLTKQKRYHEERVIALRKQARPPLDEIAELREAIDVLDYLIRVANAVEDPEKVPATTSQESEKKKWGKKRAEEVAKAAETKDAP